MSTGSTGASGTLSSAWSTVGIAGLEDVPIVNADSLDKSDSQEDGEPGSGSIMTTSLVYGHGGFSFAPISSFIARRAGFFTSSRPPELGERVVCFRREHWQRQGMVTEVEEEMSDGRDGLKGGMEGVRVSITDDNGETFQAWAFFLAPINDMEYSSFCSTEEFRESSFQRLFSCPGGRGSDYACFAVSDEEARESLALWLQNMTDADGEPVNVPEEVQAELLHIFDEQTDAAIHLYSRHTKLGQRQSLKKGGDYSIYYLALNNTLNHDDEDSLEFALPLLRHMVSRLLYSDEGENLLHPGGRVWKGDSERPVPLNMKKLKDAHKDRTVIRFRQFQSTSSSETIASRFKKRGDNRGYLWIIDIPAKFWGARNIESVAWKANEAETLFPPYSAFLVESIEEDSCHLTAVEKYYDCGSLSGMDVVHCDLNATLA